MNRRPCSWPGCKRSVPASMWGCKEHWYLLPKPLRDAIWAAYQTGQENNLGIISRAYVEAHRNAITWALSNHPPEPVERTGELTFGDQERSGRE